MPRSTRSCSGGFCHHVLNRGNARAQVFHGEGDYSAFVRLIQQASARVAMRVLAYCLMPNHFHLALGPEQDGAVSDWMHWLLSAHVRRHRKVHRGSGHIWQGRFKSFPIQEDEHLLSVLRYIERNPLRAGLVAHAEEWQWSSLQSISRPPRLGWLHPGPVPRPANWTEHVNAVMHAKELKRMQRSVVRGTPYGNDDWTEGTAKLLDLGYTLRPPGRPRKHGQSKEEEMSAPGLFP